MQYSKRVSKEMNKLLEKNYNAEKGYLILANTVENKNLKQFFKERAEEKNAFVKELKTEILSHSKITKEAISSSGNGYRSWKILKSLLSSNNEAVILEEVLIIERESLKEYDNVLNINEFEPSTLQLLEKQRCKIQHSISSIKTQNYRQTVI